MTHAKNQCPAYQVTCFKCNGLAIRHQCAEAGPILPRTQGNLTGFMVEAEHPRVKDLLLEDKSMKQQ